MVLVSAILLSGFSGVVCVLSKTLPPWYSHSLWFMCFPFELFAH